MRRAGCKITTICMCKGYAPLALCYLLSSLHPLLVAVVKTGCACVAIPLLVAVIVGSHLAVVKTGLNSVVRQFV